MNSSVGEREVLVVMPVFFVARAVFFVVFTVPVGVVGIRFHPWSKPGVCGFIDDRLISLFGSRELQDW